MDPSAPSPDVGSSLRLGMVPRRLAKSMDLHLLSISRSQQLRVKIQIQTLHSHDEPYVNV